MRVVHTNRGAIKIQDIEAEEILKNRNSFTVFKDRLSIVKHMNSEEKAQFLDYILGYQLNGNESMPEDASPITRAAIEQITTGFKLSEDRYIARVMANRKNGAKGGRKPNKNQSNPIEPNRTQSNQGSPDTDTETDTDTDTDTDTETDTDTDTDTDINMPTDEVINNYLMLHLEIHSEDKKQLYKSLLTKKMSEGPLSDWKGYLDGINRNRKKEGHLDE